ncbi:MAG: phosphoenolpyruvate carboxylase, partial [Acidimicrobiales bacterium]
MVRDPMSAPATLPEDAALRTDIRLLGGFLGETLVRHEGEGLLDLVERVRAASKATRTPPGAGARADLDAVLSGLDLPAATLLVRAFSAYFHLANIAEQVHRADERAHTMGMVSGLRATFAAIERSGLPRAEVAGMLDRLELRLVLTAHPTEVVRRSVLTKRRRVAELLELRADPRAHEADRRRAERGLAEVVDLIWQTDELRRERPTPLDEANSVVFYLDGLLADVVPTLLADLAEEARRIGVELAARARPVRFGTWVGGDRDGNPAVTPAVTLAVLALQRDVALQGIIGKIDELVSELSSSNRVVGVSAALESSLAADRLVHPEVHARY